MDTHDNAGPSSVSRWPLVPTRWALPVLATIALLAAAWAGAPFLIPFVAAAVFSVLLWPVLVRVQRVLRSRVLTAAVVVLSTAVVAGALVWAVATQLTSSTDRLPEVLRLAARDIASLGLDGGGAMRRTRSALEELDRSVARATGTNIAVRAAAVAPPTSVVSSVVDWVTRSMLLASSAALSVLLQCGAIVLLTFFVLCSGETFEARLREWCSRTASRPGGCGRVMEETARQIRWFAAVTLGSNAAIGLAVALGFAAFGVPNAIMWGVVAAALHFVPYAGLAALVALGAVEVYAVHGSVLAAALAAFYVGLVGVVVGTAMTAWLQGRASRIDSATVFAGTVFWSVLWGAWGLVLGPLLVVLLRLAVVETPALRSLAASNDSIDTGDVNTTPANTPNNSIPAATSGAHAIEATP